MSITRIHCAGCGTEFVDARNDVRAGDAAICPHCGAHHVFKVGMEAGDGSALPAADRDASRENE